MKRLVQLIFIVVSYAAFGQDPSLELLTIKERVDLERNQQSLPSKVVMRDSGGAVLKNFNPRFPVINGELFSGIDYFKNTAGKITELKFRIATQQDIDLNKKLYDIDEEQMRGSMELQKIDCDKQRELLGEVYAVEKENRKNDQVVDVETDNLQESKVISLLQQCGPPTIQKVGPDGIRVIYLVLQHARRKNQEKYFGVIEGYLKNGYLKKGSASSIEDRLLMASGKKQRYGTQIVFFAKTGYAVFPCEDPDHLDQRRAAAGLPTMDAFIKEREEFYRAEIKR